MITANRLYLLCSSSIFLTILITTIGITNYQCIGIEIIIALCLSYLYFNLYKLELFYTNYYKNRPSIHYLIEEGFIEINQRKVEMNGEIVYILMLEPKNSPYPVIMKNISDDTVEIFYSDIKNSPSLRIKLTPN